MCGLRKRFLTAEEIKADNEIRMEWNRAVDRAIVSGVSETEIVELKKTEITDWVKESVEKNGSKPELFGDIVRAAVALLERLIVKAMQKAMDIVEKVIGKAVDAIKEVPKETGSRFRAGDSPAAQPERKKIPFPVKTYRKADAQDKAGQSQQNGTPTVKKSVIEQMKQDQKPVLSQTKQLNKVIFEYEKKRDRQKKELSECTGIFKGGRRKELQQEIDGIDTRISNMKKRLSSIVKEYKFDSVRAFYKEFNAAKREYPDYKAACTEYEKIYGEKVADAMSVRDRLRQKTQAVKTRETGRVHQKRQKNKGAR